MKEEKRALCSERVLKMYGRNVWAIVIKSEWLIICLSLITLTHSEGCDHFSSVGYQQNIQK